MNFKEHHSTESRDGEGSQYYSRTVLDSGKPVALALASLLILLGAIAGFKAILTPSETASDLSDLKTRQALLEGKVTALERENKRLNDDLYDLRQNTDQRLTQLQNRPQQTTVIQQTGGFRLW